MMIEGCGSEHLHSLHHREADQIDERKRLIGEGRRVLPSLLGVGSRCEFNVNAASG